MSTPRDGGDATPPKTTRRDVRRARRASIGATFLHTCFLDQMVLDAPATHPILEEVEIRARLERAAYDELRRRRRNL
jgi:hypothetical protein